ncbi:hypothetical protein [Streptomyces mirabilis]
MIGVRVAGFLITHGLLHRGIGATPAPARPVASALAWYTAPL